MNFLTLHRNFTTLIGELNQLVLDSAMEEKLFIAELNREQLWNGETSNEGTISPKYSQDPYFKSPEAAARYAAWKNKITPSPKRDIDTPNLYINGTYHRSIYTKRDKDGITTDSNIALGQKIQTKFKNIKGLNKGSIFKLKPKITPILIDKARLILHKE
jgi:hypothetical protein